METRFRILLLIPVFVLGMTGCGLFGGKKKPPPLGAEVEAPPTQAADEPVINPEVQRRTIKTPRIRNEDFEFGGYVGIISIEDFGSSSIYGGKFNYHISEDLFLQITYGQAHGDTTSYERLAGGAHLLTDSQRKYTNLALNVGWDALPGEIFIGKGHAYNTAFYLTFGLGYTEFGSNKHFTENGGMGYRILFNRWVAANFDFRDYWYDTDLTGPKKVV